MKTYQFAVFTVVGLAIAAALFLGGRKKPCGCGKHTTTDPVPVVTDGE